MGAVILENFPNTEVAYRFINRGGTQFPVGFADELRDQIALVGKLRLTDAEAKYLETLPFIKTKYIEWLKKLKMDKNSVKVVQKGGDLEIDIRGIWVENIFWEVKLMAIISELYFQMTNVLPVDHDCDSWSDRIINKAEELQEHNCLWSDFGTRRRFAGYVQDEVVRAMRYYKGFLGTSNVALAMKYGVNPIGTSAHEAIMGMSGIFGAKQANRVWLKYWSDYFNGELGIALTDTFTTDVFLKDFDGYQARLWDGLRQDSGDPNVWAEKVLNHYKRLGIPSIGKKLVFSDNLNVGKFIKLCETWGDKAIIIGGIGTNFTNDVVTAEQTAKGIRPLNMVIKLTQIHNGSSWQDVVKLSDDIGKHTGHRDTITYVKKELGIAA